MLRATQRLRMESAWMICHVSSIALGQEAGAGIKCGLAGLGRVTTVFVFDGSARFTTDCLVLGS